MKQTSNIIKKRDFEKYEIIIPFSSILGKRKKQYLCSELEKLHPCFSDEYAYDSSFKKICRKGLTSDVYVMSKYKLAEYEGKRRFSGSGFFIETGMDKKPVRFNRVFVDKKFRWIMGLALWCLLVGLTGAVSGSLAGTRYYRSSGGDNTWKTQGKELTDNKVEAVEDGDRDLKEISLVESLLLIVDASGGKISDFEWRIDGYSEKVNVSLTGVFPEKLKDLSGQIIPGNNREAVFYRKGVPEISVSYNRKLPIISISGSALQNVHTPEYADDSLLYKTLREKIIESGGELLEEKYSPYQIEFIYREQTDEAFGTVFRAISEILERGGLAVSSINIKPLGKLYASGTGTEEFRILLSADKLPFSVFDLQLLSEKFELFSGRKKSVSSPPVEKHFAVARQTENVIEKSDKNEVFLKLGEIRKPDKSIVIFYKNAEGKIQKMINPGEEK